MPKRNAPTAGALLLGAFHRRDDPRTGPPATASDGKSMPKKADDHYQKAAKHLERAAQLQQEASKDHKAGHDAAAIQHAQTARIHTVRAEAHAEEALNAYVEHIHILMGEARHRAKNTLNLVQAIARQTATGEPETFIARFNDRIRSLASNQDLLGRSEWNGVELDDLVQAQFAYMTDEIRSRITMSGLPQLRLNAAAAQVIGLALNELATNAIKYGALSAADGQVDIGWGTDGDTFTITWTESEGPPVTPPAHRGFGTTVVTSLPEQTLDGESRLDFAPSGVIWNLTCPAAKMLLREQLAMKTPRKRTPAGKNHRRSSPQPRRAAGRATSS